MNDLRMKFLNRASPDGSNYVFNKKRKKSLKMSLEIG